MNSVQKFGQVMAIAILTLGPLAGAFLWVNHVITDPLSEAGSLAVISVIALAVVVTTLGAVVVLVASLLFWVWVFDIAWESKEKAIHVE